MKYFENLKYIPKLKLTGFKTKSHETFCILKPKTPQSD